MMDRAHPSSPSAVRNARPIPAQAGIGLRFAHHQSVLAKDCANWLEVHPENYLDHGRDRDVLVAVREKYPLSLHATGLSLGSADGVDKAHLEALAALCGQIKPGLVSDHLSWSRAGDMHLPDLLPLYYTAEALDVVADNVARVQDRLGRRILIENPSTYLAFEQSRMPEPEFLGALAARTGCGLLLDINNIAVSANNLGRDAFAMLQAYLDILPPAAIGEFHLAGHCRRQLESGAVIAIDDHGAPVSDQVWALFAHALACIGRRPTLIEWDTNIPDFEVLQSEAATAERVMNRMELAHAC